MNLASLQTAIAQFVNGAVAHWGLSSGVALIVVRWLVLEITQKLPKLIIDEEEKALANIQSKFSAPEDVALLKAVIAWIDTKIPNAGDQKYKLASLYIVAQYKDFQPYQDQIATLLSVIGQAAKQGLEGQPPK